MGAGHKRLARKIIQRSLRDAKSTDPLLREEALAYFQSETFRYDAETAEYPSELLDSVAETLQRSGVQQTVLLHDLSHLLTTTRE